MVGAWEPPVGDYVDFIQALREAAGPGRTIIVVLQRLDERGELSVPSAEEVTIWRRRLAHLGDARLAVEPLVPEPGSQALREVDAGGVA